jgi:3',5'-cyclic AMP phosphodiesterase CpdA
MVDRELTVLHASDLQCGKPFLPSAADAFVSLSHQVAPDVVVIAGDLTQRAKVREFGMASALLERLPDVPIVVTPGNHDVPLYRAWERVLMPFRNWRRFVSRELDTVTQVDGATFVALCSAAPWRAIVNGRLDAAQVGFARRAFATTPAGDLRCLVIHHHFVPVPGGDGGRPLPQARRWLEEIEAMDADVVLGGHVHRLHIATSRALLPDRDGPGVPLVACGTTTSSRGRAPEAGWNSLTVVRVGPERIEVTPHFMRPGESAFEPVSSRAFPRAQRKRAEGVALEERPA